MKDDDDDETYVPRRRGRTMLPKTGRPFKRKSHDVGLNYSQGNKKSKKTLVKNN
jgi:hypothetical protein